ncbi:hypothetical protein D3C84_652570 [compost metagenome]
MNTSNEMMMFKPIRKSTSTVGKGMISMAMIITINDRISSSGRALTLRKNTLSMAGQFRENVMGNRRDVVVQYIRGRRQCQPGV